VDKKAQKKTDVLHQRLHKLQQQLAGAKKQPDDPQEIPRLETEISQVKAELARLQSS